MKRDELLKMAALEDRHWWFTGSRRVILSQIAPLLPGSLPLLDVACGAGLTLSMLERSGLAPPSSLYGIDCSPDALAAAARKTSASLVQAQAAHLPFPDSKFGLVTLLDVLEHLPDDASGLAEAARVLRPGGSVVLTVPAHPWLYSRHDRALGHLRRYRRSEVVRLAGAAELHVQRLTACNCLLAPPIALVRLAVRLRDRSERRTVELPSRAIATSERSDLSLPPAPINAFLGTVFGCEAALLRHIDLPFGISFLGVFQKGS
ncbi:MAG: class I SAM-dependent methyltransferase [Deltaproteobacteria bacterium]|nr:class I SAM-dependent methyltransferase [Deltaproteobacteria bacterium]